MHTFSRKEGSPGCRHLVPPPRSEADGTIVHSVIFSMLLSFLFYNSHNLTLTSEHRVQCQLKGNSREQ